MKMDQNEGDNKFAILVLPGDDPNWAILVQHADDGTVLLFDNRNTAFTFAKENINDPWQIVEL